jgi:hypothetical protein
VNPTLLDKFFTQPTDTAGPSPPADRTVTEDHIYLLAGTPFEQYRDFLLKELPDSDPGRIQRIAEEWRAASLYLLQLRLTEPTWADSPQVLPIPAELDSLTAQVRADPIFHQAFSLPTEIALVELDRLVVRQELVNLAQVERLKEQLGPGPTPEQVFRVCLPFDHPPVEHGVRAVSSDTYVFTSESNDIRFLKSVILPPEQVQGIKTHGTIVGVLGIVVGYGSNYLNAIAAEGRLILNNGSHRAYALRDLGITHVPCVIQKATTPGELTGVAAGSLRKRPDFYLKEPRPPVLKDYFEPRLRQVLRLRPINRHVKVRFTVETYDVYKK